MNKSFEVLEERFPQLHFLLHLMKEEPWVFCDEKRNGERKGEFLHRRKGIDAEIREAISQTSLDKVEVLYLYGIGVGHYASFLLSWLEEDVKRDLVILEDDIEVLRLFTQTPLASSILSHPQVHIRFLLDSENWPLFLEERAQEFPYENVFLIPLEAYKKRDPSHIEEMKLHLMRKTTVHHAIYLDGMYYHVLSKNVLANFPQIHTAFYANCLEGKFSGIPAIICGAGPSLQDEIETLTELEDQALLFAGGSAITALSQAGIFPHFGVAIDPNIEEVDRFQKSLAFETPLLYTNRLHPKVFQTFNGAHGYIQAMTGGPIEKWWEEELGIPLKPLKGGFDLEALSVTTTCLELATTMGCSPIILVGVDLAFTKGAFYAAGIVEDEQICLEKLREDPRVSEGVLERKDRHGNQVYTLVKWVMESEAISRFVKNHPETGYLNSTSGGIGFSSLPYTPLKDQTFSRSFDLRGKVHQLIETHRFSFSKTSDPLDRLKSSLYQAKKIIEEALEELRQIKEQEGDPENGKLVFFQMELEELLAYSLCLEPAVSTFQKTFYRLNRPRSWKHSRGEKWHFLFAKWSSFHDLISYYIDIMVENEDTLSRSLRESHKTKL
jgi:hypothetical protein